MDKTRWSDWRALARLAALIPELQRHLAQFDRDTLPALRDDPYLHKLEDRLEAILRDLMW
jgi:hypothetical protein